MRLWRLAAVLLLLALPAWSCAPASKTPAEPTPETPPAQEAPPEPAAPQPPTPPALDEQPPQAPKPAPPSVKELVAQASARQHSPLASIYTPPEDGFGNRFSIELYQGRKNTLLFDDVKVFSGGMDGLALGFADETIRVTSQFPCSSLTMPQGGSIGLMAWWPTSPVLAVSDAKEPVIRVYELLQCSEIASLERPSMPTLLALSRDGARMAVVDEVHDLWIGPSIGPLTKAATLRYLALDLTFSPAGRMVLVADQMGWLTSWSALSGDRIRTAELPQGPLRKARFQGSRVFFTDLAGESLAFGIPENTVVDEQPEATPFSLQNGMLSHTSPVKSLLKRLHLGKPSIQAAYSPATEVLRIRDLNGIIRYYSVTNGHESSPIQADDWKPANLGEEGQATINGAPIQMADAIHQNGLWRLMARRIPDGSYFVWWTKTQSPQQVKAKAGQLPERFGIHPGQVKWRDVFTPGPATATMQE